jgi:nucleotide-binding universal stress UspA family protein
MYKKILIPLENSPTDQKILDHIKPLARLTGAKLVLLHVADGWVARNYEQLHLAESEEMKNDRAYLEKRRLEMQQEGLVCDAMLAMGEPSAEIIRFAGELDIDLIAMSTHGHLFIADLLLGETVNKVRHTVNVPILLLKARP